MPPDLRPGSGAGERTPFQKQPHDRTGQHHVTGGGGNDDDDSGTISYLSLRYGGKVVGLTNELNGLSLGGIGRGTDIHHVDIMNNVDDGVEIWGGTVNLKYLNVWNIGDDTFDVDQGWRGKAQFGLIVQGHSLDAAQGSGVGDNALELEFGLPPAQGLEPRMGSILDFVVSQPLARWRARIPVMRYLGSVFAAGSRSLPGDVARHFRESPIVSSAPREFGARFLAACGLLGFEKQSPRSWTAEVFEGVVLPWMKRALGEDRFEAGLEMENLVYSLYVKQTETEEHFRRCFEAWKEPMRASWVEAPGMGSTS